MAYRELPEPERAARGQQLAETLDRIDVERLDQEQAKKSMKARLDSLEADVARLKSEVRTGKEWIEDQMTIEEFVEVKKGKLA